MQHFLSSEYLTYVVSIYWTDTLSGNILMLPYSDRFTEQVSINEIR